MKGQFIYICKTDSCGPEQGRYIQSTRKVWPTRKQAEQAMAGTAPSRLPIVVELPEPVEIDADYYPRCLIQKKATDLKRGDVIVRADIQDEVLLVDHPSVCTVKIHVRRRFTDGRTEQPTNVLVCVGAESTQEVLSE